MDQQNLDTLFVKHLEGTLSSDEKLALDSALQQSPQTMQNFNMFCAAWEKSAVAKKFFAVEKCMAADLQCVMSRIAQHKVAKVRRITPYFARLAAASVLFVLMVAGAAYLYLNVPGFGRWTEIEASLNNQLVELPDSSMVWLSENSRIAYVSNSTKNKRLVKVTGEAYFEVRHNKQRPFVVKAGKTQVTVLGTSFNVKVSKKRSSTEVFVTNGKVEFGRENNKLILLPNEKGIYKKGKLSKIKLSNANTLFWRTNEIVFSGNTLSEVAATLENIFTNIDEVQLLSADSTTRITTKFENQPLSEIFNELQIHFNKKFILKEGTLIISD
jgi:transmembrane sensor